MLWEDWTDIMLKPSHIVSDSVILAREELGRAMREGDSRRIDLAYRALENADRLSRARRASSHSIRIAVKILEKV